MAHSCTLVSLLQVLDCTVDVVVTDKGAVA